MALAIDLTGRTVLVTGGAQGIGLAIAARATQAGARVVVCDRNRSALDAAGHELGSETLTVDCDVSDEASCEGALDAVMRQHGHLDVLVNNASIFERVAATPSQSRDDWRSVIDVNLQGTFLMSRGAARIMAKQSAGGSIVNISSITGLIGFRGSNAYGVSKAAVAMMTRTMATDLASRGVRVNAVAPGFVETAMLEGLERDVGLERSAFHRRIPMGRLGQPDEIAAAVLFLASDLARYITGVVLPVDGGATAFGGLGDASKSDDPVR